MEASGAVARFGYSPLPVAPPEDLELEEKGERGVEGDLEEGGCCKEFESWILELEEEKSSALRHPDLVVERLVRDGNGMRVVANIRHPWVFKLRNVAEKVQKYYEEERKYYESISPPTNESVNRYRRAVSLFGRVKFLDRELEMKVKRSDCCCSKGAWCSIFTILGLTIALIEVILNCKED